MIKQLSLACIAVALAGCSPHGREQVCLNGQLYSETYYQSGIFVKGDFYRGEPVTCITNKETLND